MKKSNIYRLANGVEKDYVKCIEHAVVENDKDSLLVVAHCYYIGDGYRKNYKKARIYVEKSIELGNDDAKLLKAKMLELGKGYKKNYHEAFALYMDMHKKNAYACYKVASYYIQGLLGEVDLEKFAFYIKLAAENGNIDAMNDLAYSYRYGIGVEKDMEKSKAMFLKAAKLGSLTALGNLSKIKLISNNREEIEAAKNNFYHLSNQGDLWSAINYKTALEELCNME